MIHRMLFGALLAGMTVATVCVGAQTPAQDPTPTYKASTSSIPMQIWIKDKAGKPRLGLTADDLTFKIDSKLRSFAFVSEVAGKPGWYLLNFEPAKEDRDGKEHNLEISVRGGGTLKKKMKLPPSR